LDYQNAIDSYTRCLAAIGSGKESVDQWEMQKLVLSNRAQVYLKLKKYSEAESDADAALGFDSEHVKSLQRRGTARYYLGKLRLSMRDFAAAQAI
jgi:tetratricopeptide (TPR) repeat protein